MLVHPNEPITESSCELASERFKRIACETQEILQRWDNRLVFPLSELSQRYLRGELSFHLHLGRSSDTHVPRFYLPRHDFSDGRDFRVCHEVKLPDARNDNEFPVFIDSVHVVNEPERVATRILSEIRLQSVDSCQSGGVGNALYSSAVTGHFVFCKTTGLRFFKEDRKFNLSGGLCLEFRRGQLPCHMIECASEVMNDLACQHFKPRWNCRVGNEVPNPLVHLSIFVGENWFLCGHVNGEGRNGSGSQKLSDFPVQILDVLVGPF